MAPTIDRLPARHARADILDILRGFALLGICLANAAYFALYIFQQPATILSFPTASVDRWLGGLHYALIDGKFYSLFSLLFGIGFAIIFYQKNEGQRKGLYLFYRRLFFLLLIGLAHSLLLWDGDILFFYAVVGAFLPLFRHCSDRALLTLALLFILSPLLFDLVKVLTNGRWNISGPLRALALSLDKSAGITEANTDTWLVQHNSYADLLAWNGPGTAWSWQTRLDSNRVPKVLGMFLLGMYIGRKRLYEQVDKHRTTMKRVRLWGFALGLPAGLAYAWLHNDGRNLPAPAGLLDTLAYALNVVPLALAYAASLALWYIRRPASRLLNALRPVGRMALTNYILQSFFGIAIYYGIGGGLGARYGPSFFMPVALGIFFVQVAYSHLWMRHFEYGPLEWLWRQLTYGRRLSLRKQQAMPAAG